MFVVERADEAERKIVLCERARASVEKLYFFVENLSSFFWVFCNFRIILKKKKFIWGFRNIRINPKKLVKFIKKVEQKI